jgi:hypothetical protein
VFGPSGHLGTVEAVVYESRHDVPDRLLVRSRRWGRLRSFPMADVARADREARQIVLRSHELAALPTVAHRTTTTAAVCATVGTASIFAGLFFIHTGTRSNTVPGPRPDARSTTATIHRPGLLLAKAPAPRPVPSSALTVVARRGDCWILLRERDASGRRIEEVLLTRGQHLAVRLDHPVWARIGNPAATDVYIAGRRVRRLPSLTANITFTAAGMRLAG